MSQHDQYYEKSLSELNAAFDFDPGVYASSFLHWIQIGRVLSYLIDLLAHPKSTDFSEPLLNVFEKEIHILSAEVTEYSKAMKMEDFKVDVEKSYFHIIGDIREELSMIKSVLLQQEDVWTEFMCKAWPDHWKNGRFDPVPADNWIALGDSWRYIARPQTQFQKYKRRIAQLEEDADRVEKSIATLLDLRSKHASMQEAHSSVLQALESSKEAHKTAIMSAAVFGFTIITIIFTPLSFMTSLLGMPIKELQDHHIKDRNGTDTGAYSTNYVGKWMGKISGQCKR